MSSVIYAFKRWQCLQLHFKDFNVFSHLFFQKTTMTLFTFRKTSMSPVIYAFKRRQCLHLHFKRLQCLQSFTLSKDYNVFIYISKTSTSFVFYRTQCPSLCFIGFDTLCFYASKRKRRRRRRENKKKKNFRCLPLYRTSMSWCFLSFTSLVSASCPVQ